MTTSELKSWISINIHWDALGFGGNLILLTRPGKYSGDFNIVVSKFHANSDYDAQKDLEEMREILSEIFKKSW